MYIFGIRVKLFSQRPYFALSQYLKIMKRTKTTTKDKQLLIFQIDKTHAVKNYVGTVVTGRILCGTVRLNDQVVCVDKYQRPIFKCLIADIEQKPKIKLTIASAEEMGEKSISLLIFRRLKHEFETTDFITKTE